MARAPKRVCVAGRVHPHARQRESFAVGIYRAAKGAK
jgi:hypothetical protein